MFKATGIFIRFLFIVFLLHGSLYAQTWLQIPDFPDLARDDGVAVNVNAKLYFGTGSKTDGSLGNDFYVLDPLNNSWVSIPIPSMPPGSQRQYACAFAGPGCFFVFSGIESAGSLNDLYKFDVAVNTWSAMAQKPGSGIFGSACLEFGDKVIFVGGVPQANGTASAEVWEYTISSNSWLQKSNFPYGGRFRASSAVLNNTGYLMFGIDDNNLFRREMYRYDQPNDSWSKVLDFPQTEGRAYAAMKAVNNKLIVFGGYDSINNYHKDVWYYQETTGLWTQSSDFSSFGRKGGMSVVSGSKFYYSCGINATNTRLKETWMLDVPLGIKENQNSNSSFYIYPNPVTDLLCISNNLADETAELVYSFNDVCGKEIKQVKAAGKNSILNIQDLEKGVYFLKIFSQNKCMGNQRIIKD